MSSWLLALGCTMVSERQGERHACAGSTCASMPASNAEDRLTVNWAEWRKGYSYSVGYLFKILVPDSYFPKNVASSGYATA